MDFDVYGACRRMKEMPHLLQQMAAFCGFATNEGGGGNAAAFISGEYDEIKTVFIKEKSKAKILCVTFILGAVIL